MERYKVKVLAAARRDLDEILSYINTMSPQTAMEYAERFARELESLAVMPLSCPPARDMLLAQKGYRCLIVKNYLVFFVVSGSTVTIRRILFGRRDYASLL
ncbi:MAG: type II toxin-antitoxin system RelE/ParE family toxin [Oscillospiraceae bacterium]|nr:type II toxin-antitoxin system RelE/ParE family toxin [Oscillospiraceae bacterium]